MREPDDAPPSRHPANHLATAVLVAATASWLLGLVGILVAAWAAVTAAAIAFFDYRAGRPVPGRVLWALAIGILRCTCLFAGP